MTDAKDVLKILAWCVRDWAAVDDFLLIFDFSSVLDSAGYIIASYDKFRSSKGFYRQLQGPPPILASEFDLHQGRLNLSEKG